MRPDDEGGARRALGAQLRRLRQARGLTLQEAAGRANLSFQLLSQIERDGQATTTEKLLDLVAVLGGRIEIVDAQAPAPLQIPETRAEIARSFVAVLPFIPDEEIEVFMYELALWHRRYKGEQSP